LLNSIAAIVSLYSLLMNDVIVKQKNICVKDNVIVGIEEDTGTPVSSSMPTIT